MSDPQLVTGPVWIHECQHMTISPEDPCSPCAEVAQARAEALEEAVKMLKKTYWWEGCEQSHEYVSCAAEAVEELAK